MPSQKRVYLDHNATTPVAAEVLAALPELATAWGNASSIHESGREPKRYLRETRARVAEFVQASPLEIIFTSGGSESNNTVLKGVWESVGRERPHFMCSAVEHPSIMRTMIWLHEQGAAVDFIPVDRQGRLDMEFFAKKLNSRTALVSVMAANNETGTLFPIRELAQKAHAVGALFHTDAVQVFGKLPVHLRDWNVDYASFSAHKYYSLKGTGFLFVKKGSPTLPLVHGGGQERHRRGGTENVLGIAALGVALAQSRLVAQEAERLALLRDHFEARVLEEISLATVTASETPRLPNTSSLILPGVDGETLLMSLDIKGYSVSTGAACSSGNPEPSPVLLAMGLSREEAQHSLRVSFGRSNQLEEVDEFVETLKEVVQRLRQLGLHEDPRRPREAIHA